VYPFLDAREIRDRQLEQEPALPVEVGLPPPPRPDDQVDALRSPCPSVRVNAGLVETTIALLHDEVDACSTGAEQVVPLGKACFDGAGSRLGRSPEVSRPNERRESPLVACLARARLSPKREGEACGMR